MDTSDCINILRGGKVKEGEYENGSWWYKVETPKMAVVVTFIDENELMIVTAWREKRCDALCVTEANSLSQSKITTTVNVVLRISP